VKLLVLSPMGASRDRYGGAGTSMVRLLTFSAREEVQATLLHGVPGHPFVPEFVAQSRCGTVAFTPRLRDKCRFMWSARRWLKHSARNYDAVLLLSAMYSTLRLGEYARSLGLPVIARIENSSTGLSPRPWYGKLRDIDALRYRYLSRSTAIIAKSSLVHSELLAAGVDPARIERIPQHCDTQLFSPRSAAERSEWRRNLGLKDRFTFLCVGEVVVRKRQLMLVEVLAELVRGGVDAQLVLVGPMNDVNYGRKLTEAAASLGLRDRVVFAGFMRHVQFMYFASDAFVLPSTNECMPNSLIESMGAGLPAVVSDFAGARDCVEDGASGYVIRSSDGEGAAWASRMRELATGSIAQAQGRRAREIAVDQFDSREIWRHYLRLIRRVALARGR
jgi:glycosyltransferase involved in cell wall biosynthesis